MSNPLDLKITEMTISNGEAARLNDLLDSIEKMIHEVNCLKELARTLSLNAITLRYFIQEMEVRLAAQERRDAEMERAGEDQPA